MCYIYHYDKVQYKFYYLHEYTYYWKNIFVTVSATLGLFVGQNYVDAT